MQNTDGLEGNFYRDGESPGSFDMLMNQFEDHRGEILEDFNQQKTDPPIYETIESAGPLGLKLTITPSLLDAIQRKLSQDVNCRAETMPSLDLEKPMVRNDDKVSPPMSEKSKASKFPVTLLRIGCWERVEQNVGDVVAKIYFAKKKLVWEILEGQLKSKLEIQWSDIAAIRATYGVNQHDILEVELNRPPLFAREIVPIPKKHTIWQSTSDFTGNQASAYGVHYLEFSEGTLQRHYEELLHCDHSLKLLSQKPFPSHHSPGLEMDHATQSLPFEFSMHPNPYNQPSINCHPCQIPHIGNPQPITFPSRQFGVFDNRCQQVRPCNSIPVFGPKNTDMITNSQSSDLAPIEDHPACVIDQRPLYSSNNLPLLEGNAGMNPVLHEPTTLCQQGIQTRSVNDIEEHQHQFQGLPLSAYATPALNFNPRRVSDTQCTSGTRSVCLNKHLFDNSHTSPYFDEQIGLQKCIPLEHSSMK